MRFGCKKLAMGLILAALAFAGSAQAASITYQFTGQIEEISGSPPFSLNQMVTGSVSWSDGLGVKSSSATQTVYNGMGMLSFSIEGFGPSGTIDELVITDNGPDGDGFSLRSSAFLDSSEFTLGDTDDDVFDGFMIPLMLNLEDFSGAIFVLDLPGSGVISGNIESLTMMQVVPEPATAGLLALGLLGLALSGRRP